MSETTAKLNHARKSFGSIEALRGVSFSIDRGEVVAMLGPNGAGKTTCISLMLGLRKPTSGQVELFGRDPGDRRARSRCGVMLQESGVTDMLKVQETVNLFRAYYPQPMPTMKALDMAGLVGEAEKKVSALSGGQRQRLYYALAVCGDPEAIFLDEPTVGMDVESRRAFLAGIKAFAAQGRTIVLTTHYLEEADELAQRILVFDHGLVIADDSPDRIKSQVGGKRISFSSSRALSESDFAGLPHRRLELDQGRVRVFTDEPEAVLNALFGRDVEIRNLEVIGADLEEAFLTLTSRSHNAKESGTAVAAGDKA
jgi:ABC-2 type transport system ATP-binding protein